MVDHSRFSGDPEFMMSLAKGLAVLRLVANTQGQISIAEAARRTGFSRSAARRCLYTLSQLGYVAWHNEGFVIQNEHYSLGSNFVGTGSLASRATPILERLRDELGESCSLGILDGDHVRYIARAQTSRIMSINLYAGSRLPLCVTSMGRVLLAGCDQPMLDEYLGRTSLTPLTGKTVTDPRRLLTILEGVKRDGYAIVDQELEIGLRSVAVPVESSGRVIAALNIGCAASRIPIEEMLTRFLPRLRKASEELRA
ncbi:IclR family pca regulon transcriptional regulator [Altererythrobacter atlanticus]|uniref:Pca regulon regulatory protein n=1 Tax=Croceibacterium atlanticum TaxID=1267766 RepID=A0A0F7KVY3_9SPHN|nr:IclR family transcriptional regulator C-terminal domain-containing protein [Croceibacterium atlanticum]AKH42920.1 Pca regulon regulatory protein [Croceibacterium atlanticum]MBB5731700.1 IclR family pca regulon transcriptional regulator [Croceibacterium atlanticum]